MGLRVLDLVRVDAALIWEVLEQRLKIYNSAEMYRERLTSISRKFSGGP